MDDATLKEFEKQYRDLSDARIEAAGDFKEP